MAQRKKIKEQGKSFSDQLSDLADKASAAGIFGSRRKLTDESKKKRKKVRQFR